MNISDIKLGGLYCFPEDNVALFSFDDPSVDTAYVSISCLPKQEMFVVLNILTLKDGRFRMKILTPKGEMFWMSLRKSDLSWIKSMSSCDKHE
jgi:hypothetical protein